MAVVATCPPYTSRPASGGAGFAVGPVPPTTFGVEVPFFELPPEMAQEMREAHERHRLQMELSHREVRSFLHELTDDQARVLWMVFSGLTQEDDDAVRQAMCADWQGYLRGLMEFKFGKCVCGKDHDHDDDPSILLGDKQGHEGGSDGAG